MDFQALLDTFLIAVVLCLMIADQYLRKQRRKERSLSRKTIYGKSLIRMPEIVAVWEEIKDDPGRLNFALFLEAMKKHVKVLDVISEKSSSR